MWHRGSPNFARIGNTKMPKNYHKPLPNIAKSGISPAVWNLRHQKADILEQTEIMARLKIQVYIYMYVVELRICRNTVVYSVFIHRKATTTGHSEVFEVQVAKTSIVYLIFTMFLRSARQKPLQTAMFLSSPWPRTPLFTVFLNTLYTAICDVSGQKYRYLRGFFNNFAQSREA